MACASSVTAFAQYANEFTVRSRACGRLRHLSNAKSMPRRTASNGMPPVFQASINAQSSGENMNVGVPRAARKQSSMSLK
jgi:hypothetical protein